MDTSRFDLKFKAFGVPIRIMPSFWLLAILFSPFTSGFSGRSSWLFGLFGWIVATTLSFIAHELGHSLVARRLVGARPRVELGFGRMSSGAFGFGGVSTWDATNSTPTKAALIALAGPFSEVAVAAIFFALAVLCGNHIVFASLFGVPMPVPLELFELCGRDAPLALFTGYFAVGFYWMSIFWGLSNLLPIVPLDGGIILLSALAKFCARPATKALAISSAVGLVLGLICFRASLYFATFMFLFLAFQNFKAFQAYSANSRY